MKTKTTLSILTIMLCVILWSCGGGNNTAGTTESTSAGNTTGVTDTEITVGSFGPLTGPAALWGNIMMGMDAYMKMINDEGGVAGRKINFVMKDDAYDPSRTVPGVRELIQRDEVFAFVGGIGTAPCMSVMDNIVEEKIPWISPISGATHWSMPLKDNIFSVLPYYIDEAVIQTQYALESLGTKTIGIIYQNDDVGKSALVGARSVLKKNGLDFVAEVPVEITDTDLSSHIARLKDSGADVVLLWTLPRQGVITVTSANVIGYQPQWIASFILSDMTLMYDLTKGAWKDVIYGSFATPPFDYTNEKILKYKAALAKYYPDVRWGVFSFAGFMYGEPFVEGLRQCGKDLTRENLIAAMNNLKNYDLMGTKLSFSKDNHQGLRSMQLLKCINAEEYEVVSEEITSDSDIHALVKELEGM